MKCEHCGKNEATFYYKSNINGKVTRLHLCSDCAEALGYTESLRKSFRPTSLFGEDFFTRPFGMLGDLLGGFENPLLTEFPEPRSAAQGAEEPAAQAKPQGGLVPEQEQKTLRSQRERNALQAQLKTAIAEERFEDAAKLRDQIRTLPL